MEHTFANGSKLRIRLVFGSYGKEAGKTEQRENLELLLPVRKSTRQMISFRGETPFLRNKKGRRFTGCGAITSETGTKAAAPQWEGRTRPRGAASAGEAGRLEAVWTI